MFINNSILLLIMEVKQLTDINKENLTMFLVDIEQEYNVNILDNIILDNSYDRVVFNNFSLVLNELEKVSFKVEYSTINKKEVLYIVLQIDFRNMNSFFCKCYFTN